jgi:23S rRNA pseudouridine2457 synthase
LKYIKAHYMDNHRHFILHKPYDYLSQFITNARKRKNSKLLGELFDFPDGTMSIGRLDKDSEGLLLLTTDGKVSAHITGSKVEKEYYVQLDGIIDEASIATMASGIDISIKGEIFKTTPCRAHRLEDEPNFLPRTQKIRDDRHGPTCWLSITIKEGKFRQVRKMTAAVGFPTLRLMRVRIGGVHLGDLQAGMVVEVGEFLV